MNNILLIGSDTPHRRFIINKLIDSGNNIMGCLFFDSLIKPKFNVDSPWSVEETNEVIPLYSKETRSDLDRVPNVSRPNSLKMGDPLVRAAIARADFVIVSGADRLQNDILREIEGKSLNVHLGIAEAYRGLDSNLWAWYHRDYENIGVTLHKLQASLDTGDLYQVGRIKITHHLKVWELRYHESVLAVTLIEKTLNDIANQRVSCQPQKSRGRYYSFMPFDIKKCLQVTLTSPTL